MQRFAFIFVLLMLLPDIYIYFAHIQRLNQNLAVKLCWFLPTLILMVVYFIVTALDHNALSTHQALLANLSTWMIALGLSKLLFIPFSLLGWLISWISKGHIPSGPFLWAAALMSALTLLVIVIGRFWGIRYYQVKQVTVQSARVPKGFDQYRIVQISDMHTGSFEGRHEDVKKLVEKINSLEADLVVFTGDLVNARAQEAEAVSDLLRGIHARDGVYSILGNHDYGTYFNWESPREQVTNLQRLKDVEASMGWRMLNNDNVILRHGSDSIALIGVENAGKAPFPDFSDLGRAVRGTEGMYRILLSHDPTHWEREVLPQTDIDLTLSGHTHATQLRIGGFSPSRWVYKQWAGLYEKAGRMLYVNSGIGYVGIPFRFGAWPEITLLTLSE